MSCRVSLTLDLVDQLARAHGGERHLERDDLDVRETLTVVQVEQPGEQE